MSGGGRTSTTPVWVLCAGFLIALGVILRRSSGEVSAPMAKYWVWPLLAGIALLVLITAGWWIGRGSSARNVRSWSRRSRRQDGVASFGTIVAVSSVFALRRRLAVLRPSLSDLSWWERRRVPALEFATPLARVGLARVWSSVEEVTVRIGGPRTGKTGEMCGRILDAPGAVIATSTRTDLIEHTALLRADKGPVQIFNPGRLGNLASTISFDPLLGCEDPATAAYRASDLLASNSNAGTSSDREFWDDLGRGALAMLLHAAALGGMSMLDVLGWVANPASGSSDIQTSLHRSPASGWEQRAAQFLDTNSRTQSSICATIMPALSWLADPAAAAVAGPDGPGFDVAELLESRGTVYLLGAEEAQTAPLVTALTGHIAREARRLASTSSHGRLDPPLTLCLDEAALICPVPLDMWTADMGGRGVTIHIAAQSRAQLRKRWGDAGAGAILNNASVVMLLGGLRDADDLASFSTLTGERDEPVPTMGMRGEITGFSSRRVPVLSAGQIAQLPAGQVLIIRRGMPPAVGKLQMVWSRRDYRAAMRHQRATARRGSTTMQQPRPRHDRVVDGEVLQPADAGLAPEPPNRAGEPR